MASKLRKEIERAAIFSGVFGAVSYLVGRRDGAQTDEQLMDLIEEFVSVANADLAKLEEEQ